MNMKTTLQLHEKITEGYNAEPGSGPSRSINRVMNTTTAPKGWKVLKQWRDIQSANLWKRSPRWKASRTINRLKSIKISQNFQSHQNDETNQDVKTIQTHRNREHIYNATIKNIKSISRRKTTSKASEPGKFRKQRTTESFGEPKTWKRPTSSKPWTATKGIKTIRTRKLSKTIKTMKSLNPQPNGRNQELGWTEFIRNITNSKILKDCHQKKTKKVKTTEMWNNEGIHHTVLNHENTKSISKCSTEVKPSARTETSKP